MSICVNAHCLMLDMLRNIALNALNTVQKIKAMLKMGKEHTHTLWLITSLILNGFSIRKSFGKLRLRAFQPYHQTLCILKHVGDVRDRSSTPKGCNAIYVRDVEDLQYTQKFQIKWNFELTVFELTIPDLY